jgi:hypothetical protein
VNRAQTASGKERRARRGAVVLAALGAIGGWLSAEGAARGASACEGPLARIVPPTGWSCAEGADPSAQQVAQLRAPGATGGMLLEAVVLVGAPSSKPFELDRESARWHTARLRNRSAWGVGAAGSASRESAKLASQAPLVRFRDPLGSSLGAREQTLSCTLVERDRKAAPLLACTAVTAPVGLRAEVDRLSDSLLSTLTPLR